MYKTTNEKNVDIHSVYTISEKSLHQFPHSRKMLAVLYSMTADSKTVRSEREYQSTMEHISIDIMSDVDKRRRYHRLLYVKNSIIIHNYVFRFC